MENYILEVCVGQRRVSVGGEKGAVQPAWNYAQTL